MMLGLIFGLGIGFIIGALWAIYGYQKAVRDAFGIEDRSVRILGWLKTRAVKRKLDEAKRG